MEEARDLMLAPVRQSAIGLPYALVTGLPFRNALHATVRRRWCGPAMAGKMPLDVTGIIAYLELR